MIPPAWTGSIIQIFLYSSLYSLHDLYINKLTQSFGVTKYTQTHIYDFFVEEREQSRKLLVITEAFVINDEIIAHQSTSITITQRQKINSRDRNEQKQILFNINIQFSKTIGAAN